MSPRCIVPGRTWLITRRTTRRHFLMRPDADGASQNLYWYATAVTAAKFGIQLHAVQALSTHLHEVLTDVRGVLPAFLRERNRLLANALKCHRDWPEEVFQRAPASCVALYGADAIAKEIGYTLANCVEAGLVNDPREWPGVTVDVDDIGKSRITVRRPPIYFDPKNPKWPEEASISLVMPSALESAHEGRARHVLRTAVKSAVVRARELAQKAGHIANASLKKLVSTPFTRQARAPDPVRDRVPTIATAGNPHWTSIAANEKRIFLDLYIRARSDLRHSLPRIGFPFGAWRWPRELLSPPPQSSAVA